MEKETIVKKYKEARDNLVKALAEKWEVEFYTPDNFNYDFADIWINLINIEYCLENNITFDQYLQWYDYSLEQSEKEEPIVNLENYTRYFKGFKI